MSQRKSVNGRPSGTDGSDFSYRMVVDSRYQKVAQGKSRLCKLIFIQGFIPLLAAVTVFLSTVEGGDLNRLSVSSCVIFFISLLIGELGRKRSRAILLKLYLFGSSIALIVSAVSVLQSKKSVEEEKLAAYPDKDDGNYACRKCRHWQMQVLEKIEFRFVNVALKNSISGL